MSQSMDLERIEAEAYRSRFDDGLVDCFFGVALVWIGACWVWLPDFAGLAGVIPAVFVVPFITARTRFLEQRAGHVRFTERRRSWERRRLGAMVAAGAAVFLLGIGTYVVVEGGGPTDLFDAIAPGLIAAIIAVLALTLGVMTGVWRFAGYAVVLVVTAVGAAILDTNPGAPLLVSGLVVAVCGLVLVRRFVVAHPLADPTDGAAS